MGEVGDQKELSDSKDAFDSPQDRGLKTRVGLYTLLLVATHYCHNLGQPHRVSLQCKQPTKLKLGIQP